MQKLGYYIERFGPIALSAVAAYLLYRYDDFLVASAREKSINFSGLYAAIFDWSAIQTGFLFGIFGFVAGKTTGFIAAVRNTPAMRLFIGYTRIAIFLGFVLTFYSIPMMVTSFDIGQGGKWFYFVFATWCVLAVWAFFAFLRVAYIFGLLLRPADPDGAA